MNINLSLLIPSLIILAFFATVIYFLFGAFSKKGNSMKSEMKQCACVKCKAINNEVIIYEEGKCNHILHLVISIITGVWVVIWALIWLKSKKTSDNNKLLALSQSQCKECGGALMIIS